MRRALGAAMWLALACAGAENAAGDADRGRGLFRRLGCIVCHSVDGQGGGYAPDLAKRISRDQTPLDMAAGLWNRGPLMWAMLQKKRLTIPEPSEQDFADLFAYFYSARYFERSGEAARGRAVFHEKRCGDCHASSHPSQGQAPGVAQWPPLADPVVLLERMWGAVGAMKEAMERRKIPWPELSSQEAADLCAFIETSPGARLRAGQFVASSGQSGERLFVTKGCRGCHQGAHSLAGRFSGRTVTDFAVAMWNHIPGMGPQPPELSYGEMRQLAGYLWGLQIIEPVGSAARGRQLFAKGECAACHGNVLSGASRLAVHWMRPFTLMAALWRHGPHMQDKLAEGRRSWPRFTKTELADLGAYLAQSGPRAR